MPTYLTDPNLCFLNHGSFGATPQEILDVQTSLRREMERSPVDFLHRQISHRVLEARTAVATFLNADVQGTVFTHNATTGINAVISSLPFQNGDEILTTNHRYDAVRNTLEHTARRYNAHVIEAKVPFPIHDADQVVAAIEGSITTKTKLLVIDHITSPTALIFPINQIIELAHSHGIPILVDGAHSPGQIDVDLDELGADFWVGNFHKWLCAPKGCAVLYVDPKWRDTIHPPVISHGYSDGFIAQFDWSGTDDPTAWLCAPHAIALHRELGGAQLRAAHHRLVQLGRSTIATALNVQLPHPDDPKLYGAMAAIPLPCTPDRVPTLFQQIREKDRIEVPIITWDGRAWCRISGFAAYNSEDQYVALARALKRRLSAE